MSPHDNPFDALRAAPAPVTPVGPATVSSDDGMDLEAVALLQQEVPQWSVTDTAATIEDAPQEQSMDWQLVRELRETVARRLEAKLSVDQPKRAEKPDQDSQAPLSAANLRRDAETRRALAEPVLDEVLREHATQAFARGMAWDLEIEAKYRKAVIDTMFGLGRWQPLLEITDAENIIIMGTRPVLVDHSDGRRTILPPVADSNEELMEQISLLAQNSIPPRAFDPLHIDVTINYQDKFRIHAVSDEVSREPSVAIRQHLHTRIGLGDLVKQGVMSQDVAIFLAKAVALRLSIIVVGDVGDGKTTTLRCLIDAIPQRERFATLETDLELFAHLMPGREYTLVLTARDGMGERNPDGTLAGAIPVEQLIPPSLRQAITRIIVGELRGTEAAAMFEAMQTAAGAMATLHVSDASDAPERLATLAARSPIYSLEEAQRQIAQSVDLVVHIRKVDLPGGGRKRFVQSIISLRGGEEERAARGEIYSADRWTGQQISFTPSNVHRWEDFDHVDVTLNSYEDEEDQA